MGADVSFKGVFPILVTPFDEMENVDLDSFVRVVRFMAEIGVDGVTILGVLGESNRMVDSEREELIMAAVAAADGRIPVVVGTSHKGTEATRYLSLMAESLGAAAIMVTPSKEAVPNEERIFEYFRTVAEGITIPIVLQDHPGSTEVHMSASLILRMVNEIPRIACIKQEAPPTPAKIAALIGGMKERRVPVLTGLGALYGMFDRNVLRTGWPRPAWRENTSSAVSAFLAAGSFKTGGHTRSIHAGQVLAGPLEFITGEGHGAKDPPTGHFATFPSPGSADGRLVPIVGLDRGSGTPRGWSRTPTSGRSLRVTG